MVWSSGVTRKKYQKARKSFLHFFLSKFDILYNRTNSAELVGKTGIYLGENNIRTFASYLIRLRPSLIATDPR